ncbi:metalloregulator ArsR/SmtB family transcription factor [bacterium]|nr:metalloregulator ArsR/SmtB family transcription factor [bacterium]
MMIFTALADPTRLRIVEMLATGGRMPASRISSQFRVSAPAISQHLKVLREARLVKMEVKAQQRIYEINPEGLSDIEHWISKMKQQWEERFDALDALLKEEMKQKKQPPRSHHDVPRQP